MSKWLERFRRREESPTPVPTVPTVPTGTVHRQHSAPFGTFDTFGTGRGGRTRPTDTRSFGTFDTVGTASEIDEAEREAIAIELGEAPLVYARALAAIQAHPPADVPSERWQTFIDDAALFLDQWGKQAQRLGWTVEDLFGLHPRAPMARYDHMGLLWMLRGELVVALTSIEARLSGGLAHYRHRPYPLRISRE
jgi:hypothetical protein